MNDEHEQDYKDAAIARIGADRMAMGLSIIPHPVKGDMEWVKKYRTAIEEIREVCDDQREEIDRMVSLWVK